MDLDNDYDLDAGYQLYLERFTALFGDKPPGAFAKLGRHMISKLTAAQFAERLPEYVRLHHACTAMLTSGATISDAIVMEFAEVAAWVCVKAPDLLGMFRGELGDPDATAPTRRPTRPAPRR